MLNDSIGKHKNFDGVREDQSSGNAHGIAVLIRVGSIGGGNGSAPPDVFLGVGGGIGCAPRGARRSPTRAAAPRSSRDASDAKRTVGSSPVCPCSRPREGRSGGRHPHVWVRIYLGGGVVPGEVIMQPYLRLPRSAGVSSSRDNKGHSDRRRER